MSAGATTSSARLRTARPRTIGRAASVAIAGGALAALVLGFAFAGSETKLAAGVRVAGVNVGGRSPADAYALLQRRAARLADVPVTFVAASRRWRLTPEQLGVRTDWAAAIRAAQSDGDGFAPVRGLRRIHTRVFGTEIVPPTRVFEPALRYAVNAIEREVAKPAREASVVLRGLRPVVVASRTGTELDRATAEALVVRSLAGFSRAPVTLPVRRDPPSVDTGDLQPVAAQVRTAVSKPVRLVLGSTRWRIPRWRIALLLALPRDGRRTLEIGGAEATRWFARLGRAVNRPARDARFVAGGDGSVSVEPSAPGLALAVRPTADALLAAALSRTDRTARVVTRGDAPELTTAEARRMGVTRVLSTFTTAYAGSADRIHNLQLAVSLLDGARVAPGSAFSFNERVGERTEERGFRSAPVIIGGEYEEGVGGGVSQVATTVFNAAWEAGLPITERAAHALYISRYPLGRDATVNFPNLDLRFVNDTRRWVVVRAWAGDVGITVALLGAPSGRRVASEAGELRETGPVPIKRIGDPTLVVGTEIVEEEGAPPTSVTVRRTVYDANGSVRARQTWTTTYLGEKRVLRVGTRVPPKPDPAAKPTPAPADRGAPAPSATTPTETTPSPPAAPGTATTPASPSRQPAEPGLQPTAP